MKHTFMAKMGLFAEVIVPSIVPTDLGVLIIRPLALALAKTDMWEGHAGQTQATSIRMQNPFGFHYLSVTVLSGIPGIW